MGQSRTILNKQLFIRMIAVALTLITVIFVFGQVYFLKANFENNLIVGAVHEQSADYDVKVDIIPVVFKKNIPLAEANEILLNNGFFDVDDTGNSINAVYMRQFSKPKCPGNYFVYLTFNKNKKLVAASAERQQILCM